MVTVGCLVRKLQTISDSAAQEPFKNLREWAYRFLNRRRLSIRRITRNVVLGDDELQRRATSFLESVDRCFVTNSSVVFLNMDQTAVNYDMKPRHSIDIVGSKSVQSCVTPFSGDRVTVALTICSTGEKLKPFIIFKGTPNGRIARSFRSRDSVYPQGAEYAVQNSAWMDESLMLLWIER